MRSQITESIIEQAATLDWFREVGYSVMYGPDVIADVEVQYAVFLLYRFK